MRWQTGVPSWSRAVLLLTALATSSCQALIGLDDVGPRPAAAQPLAGAGSSAGTAGMAQGGSTSLPEPSAGAPCNVELPLVSAAATPAILVVATPTPPAIDGEADEIWCLARKFQPQLSAGDSGGLALSVSGRLAWDENRLYVLLEVEDDILYQEGFFWYENDHGWLGLDPTPGDADGDELLFGFTTITRDAQDFESWPVFDRTRLVIAHARDADSSTFEVSIPWELMTGFMPATGKELGFELRVADTDDGAVFSSLSWANADEYSYEQPGSWGRMTLVGPR